MQLALSVVWVDIQTGVVAEIGILVTPEIALGITLVPTQLCENNVLGTNTVLQSVQNIS